VDRSQGPCMTCSVRMQHPTTLLHGVEHADILVMRTKIEIQTYSYSFRASQIPNPTQLYPAFLAWVLVSVNRGIGVRRGGGVGA